MMKTTERQIIAQSELPDMRPVGGRLRAGCPIHGSDHQRSLSIQSDGEYAGFGRCHACGAEVLVRELNPEAAERLERGRAQGQTPGAQRPLTAQDLLAPPRRKATVAQAAEQQDWQREELETLLQLTERMRQRLTDARPLAYLAERAIPLEIAQAAGVGYIPADARLTGRMRVWCDRMVFPLRSPMGAGFIGRSLEGWEPGMDENAHKALFDQPGATKRWYKTYPAGWMGYEALREAELVVLVEGAFDALALQTAGLCNVPVVAIAGKDMRADWLEPRYCPKLRKVVLAFDGDDGGAQGARKLARELALAGLETRLCFPTADDGMGKDWSERTRKSGIFGVEAVFDAVDELEVVR